MPNNGLRCHDLGVRQNRGRRGVGWGPMSGSWCRQAFVGKTNILRCRPIVVLYDPKILLLLVVLDIILLKVLFGRLLWALLQRMI